MKIYKIVFCCSLVLVMYILFGTKLAVYANNLFDGGYLENNENYGSGNVPMPSMPSIPSQYSNSSSNDSSSSYKPASKPVHKPSTYDNWGIQAGNEIGDSIVEAQKLKALKIKQAADKKAELEAKLYAQEQAKKKKDAEKWLNGYTGSLKDSDPIKTKSDYKMPKIDEVKDLSQEEFQVPQMSKIKPVIKPVIKVDSNKNYGTAKSESELKNTYDNANKQLMKCANGSIECSSEEVKTLQIKRLTAEQGITLHYNYKEINGKFIKKP